MVLSLKKLIVYVKKTFLARVKTTFTNLSINYFFNLKLIVKNQIEFLLSINNSNIEDIKINQIKTIQVIYTSSLTERVIYKLVFLFLTSLLKNL